MPIQKPQFMLHEDGGEVEGSFRAWGWRHL